MRALRRAFKPGVPVTSIAVVRSWWVLCSPWHGRSSCSASASTRNAQEMESTYIQRNIDATCAAYGLD